MKCFSKMGVSGKAFLLLCVLLSGDKKAEAYAADVSSNDAPLVFHGTPLGSAAYQILSGTGWNVAISPSCNVPVTAEFAGQRRSPMDELEDIVEASGCDLLQSLSGARCFMIVPRIRQEKLQRVQYGDRREGLRPMDRGSDSTIIHIKMENVPFAVLVCEAARLARINVAYDPVLLSGGIYTVESTGVPSLEFIARKAHERGLQFEYWVRDDSYLIHGGVNSSPDTGAAQLSDQGVLSTKRNRYSGIHLVVCGLGSLAVGAVLGGLLMLQRGRCASRIGVTSQ